MQPVIFALLAIAPWVNPFSVGPTPIVVNSIVSAVCLSVWFLSAAILKLGSARTASWREMQTGWFCAAVLSAIAGLLQYSGHQQTFAPWVSNALVGEAYANLRQRNHFATLVNVGLATVLWWSLVSRIPLAKATLWAAALLLATANAASSSRTGLLQLVLLAMLVGAWRLRDVPLLKQTMVRVLVFSVLTYFAACLLLPLLIGLDPNNSGILGRFRDTSAACQSRLVLWSNVLHLIAQKPWLGWGWGELDFAHFDTLYPGSRFCDILDNAHNLPLHLAVELGVPFALLFCGTCIWLIAREKPWRECNPTRQLAWTVLALIGLHSLLEYPLWYGPFQVTVLLCFYMLWRTPASWREGVAPVKPLQPMVLKIASAAAVLVMAACAYAAWDYWRISQIYTAPTLRDPAYQEDTLSKIQGSWLFKNQVRFAELSITPLTPENAGHINALAKDMLHFSPEAKVVKKLIESSVMLQRDEEAAYYMQRFKAAFPNAEL